MKKLDKEYKSRGENEVELLIKYGIIFYDLRLRE